ncbi:homocysteine-responsive endoplasmic reticulum-resident ubiquitin-like domain member 2 protein [Venturia canescens]|uniref:homocysteine-responsive endoplasmic reticulum-resident ubiquitin-like domain member 2 protein n=1 Tax=Venturia canescens TaxID=32260 RepID=UPI001C9CC71B|nr:homocysteine-responsive endoplasmic reticulum-resident ubiquitin-like domain member 2 protein [Venturia canescens]
MEPTRYGNSDDNHVKLIVKAPNQEIQDQIIECTLEWTVARLKDHLFQVYPTKPKVEEQNIILMGRLLNDSMILRDVLHPEHSMESNLLIIHLVCRNDERTSLPDQEKSCGSNDSVDTNSEGSAHVTAGSRFVEPSVLEQYYSQLSKQQIAWMQQAYAHYFTRYMQIMAAQGIQVESNPMFMQTNDNTRATESMYNNVNITANNHNNIQNNNEVDQRPELARIGGGLVGQPEADANNDNNNGPANDAAALNRDWLDIFDMLSRIVVLSSIVYFYSSPSRFLVVTFLGFAIYLIQGGFFRAQPGFLPAENNNARIPNNNNQVRQNDAAPPAEQAPTPIHRVQPTLVSGGDEQAETRTNLNEENERPGAWAFTWTFFSSFFASLIPDQPNVI